MLCCASGPGSYGQIPRAAAAGSSGGGAGGLDVAHTGNEEKRGREGVAFMYLCTCTVLFVHVKITIEAEGIREGGGRRAAGAVNLQNQIQSPTVHIVLYSAV